MQTLKAQKTALKNTKVVAFVAVNCYNVCKLAANAVNVTVNNNTAALQHTNSNVAQN